MTDGIPTWYCPPGVALPPSCPWTGLDCVSRLVEGIGPDADAGDGPGGGMVYGSAYRPKQAGWCKTSAGYWINWEGVEPAQLLRQETNPRITDWAIVRGSLNGHRWRVPRLLRLAEENGRPVDPPFYVSALDRVWGKDGWTDPAEFQHINAMVIRVANGVAISQGGNERDLVALVASILELGHHGSLVEWEAVGWISRVLLFRVLLACTGTPAAL